MAKYQVVRKCHGFLNKLWLPGIVDSNDYANWPKDENGIPRHIVKLKRVQPEEYEPIEVDEYGEPMTMEQASNPKVEKPETASNAPIQETEDDLEEFDEVDEEPATPVANKTSKKTTKKSRK